MGRAKVQNWIMEYENAEEFGVLKREIFGEHGYFIELGTTKPVIIDAGAHIGLATAYFKWLYPDSEITAIEPNPRVNLVLQKNVAMNQWWGVEVEEVALAGKRGSRAFYWDKSPEQWFSTGGFSKGAWNGKQQSWEVQVKTVPLADFITEPVDLVKLDIEGAEGEVLQAAGDKLQQVKHILMEYHPVKGNEWERIRQVLEQQGFKVNVGGEKKRNPGLRLVEAHRNV
jgi:FkbM family methyltransferase